MRILIVDDSNSIRKLVGGMITDCGHSYEIAENGQVAIDRLLNGESFDLILVDWNMPIMTGIEFVEKAMSEKLCSCPVVMMTTEKSPEKIQRALKAGAAEYIMKPFTADILKEKIDRVAS